MPSFGYDVCDGDGCGARSNRYPFPHYPGCKYGSRGPYTPPVHYERSDGVLTCVHAIPVGPDSCQDCRFLAEE